MLSDIVAGNGLETVTDPVIIQKTLFFTLIYISCPSIHRSFTLTDLRLVCYDAEQVLVNGSGNRGLPPPKKIQNDNHTVTLLCKQVPKHHNHTHLFEVEWSASRAVLGVLPVEQSRRQPTTSGYATHSPSSVSVS